MTDQTTICELPSDRPVICPACGATADDNGCRIDRPNRAVLLMLEETVARKAWIDRLLCRVAELEAGRGK